MIDVQLVTMFKDNYCSLIKTSCGKVAVVDPGEADPVIEAIEEQSLSLDYILITHHHWDHVGGIGELKIRYPSCKVIAPHAERNQIESVDITLKDNETFNIGEEEVRAITTPGHTLGSTCYYFPKAGTVFTGDTLFSLGCGRIFEGTPTQMFNSFEKLKSLPDDTKVYCGHEYTRGNAGFCLSVDPNNKDLRERIVQVKALRSEGKSTLPSTIGLEKKTNVFMRTNSPEEFASLRHKKDVF